MKKSVVLLGVVIALALCGCDNVIFDLGDSHW